MEIIHHHFDTLSSTNDWGTEHISNFTPGKMTVISASEQIEGRGRYGRRWFAPKGLNIYASFCFFISESQRDPLSLTHLMAISASRMIGRHGVVCRIKWPNDVMVDNKKIAGILCETVPFPHHFGVVIGIGLNVNMPKDLLQTIEQPATSLLVETHQEWNLHEELTTLATYFTNDLQLFLKEGFTPFLPQFRHLILPTFRDL